MTVEEELGRGLTDEEKQAIEYAKKCTSRDVCGHVMVPIANGDRCVRVAMGELVQTDGRATLIRGTQWIWHGN